MQYQTLIQLGSWMAIERHSQLDSQFGWQEETETEIGSESLTESPTWSVTGSQWATGSGILITLMIRLMFESGTGKLRLTELLTGLRLNLKIQMESGLQSYFANSGILHKRTKASDSDPRYAKQSDWC